MLIITSAVALAAAATSPVQNVPTSLDDLELVQFRKKLPFRDRHERQGERIAKKANCKFSRDAYQWVQVRVEAAISFNADGSVKKVVPQKMGCTALEDYAVAHYKKYGKRGYGPVSSSGKWFRTAMNFRWPG